MSIVELKSLELEKSEWMWIYLNHYQKFHEFNWLCNVLVSFAGARIGELKDARP